MFWVFFLNYYCCYFLVFTASHDTQSRGDAARRPTVGSRCCISTCQCLLARLLRKREVSTAAVTLGNTCWQCRLHTSGLSATGAIDSHQVICGAFLRVWQFVFVFICLIYLFGGKRKRKKKEEEENLFCFRKKKMNVRGGCGRSPWSVTNLCPVVLLWPLRDIWMYVWLPGPALFLTNCAVRLLPHTGLYFRKTSAINPSICASMTFHLCACENVCLPRRRVMCFFCVDG